MCMFGFGARVVVIVVVEVVVVDTILVDVVLSVVPFVEVISVSKTVCIVDVVIFSGGNGVVCISSGVVCIANAVVTLVVCKNTVDVDMAKVVAWGVVILADEREVVADIADVVLFDLSKLITGTTDETE